MSDLIPGRDCGECTVCCSALTIDKPDIQKESQVMCRHCDAGCTIYQTRPQVCRDFHCAWQILPILGEDWRPDRSGVFAEVQMLDGVTGINLTLVGDPLQTVRESWFIDFIASGVTGNIPLFLTLPGPRGHQGAQSMMNIRPMREAAAVSREQVKALLDVALKRLIVYRFQPHVMRHSGQDVGI